ncbi:hypothetical protein ACJZ2D_002516 [Fusarium nematophilum]
MTTSITAKIKLEGMPPDLPGVYRRIFDNIHRAEKEYAVLVLGWVVVSRRPMTVTELATAVAFKGWKTPTAPREKDLIEFNEMFKVCRAILYHDQESDTINLIHQSARDYLLSNGPPAALPRQLEGEHPRNDPARDKGNPLAPIHLSKREVQAYGFLNYVIDHLRDVKNRLDLIVQFAQQSQDLGSLPLVRDYWLDHKAMITLHRLCSQFILGWSGMTFYRPSDSHLAGGKAERCKYQLTAEFLLDRGADLSARQSKGKTALGEAMARKNHHLAYLLLQRGADPFSARGSEKTSYPKLEHLRSSVEKWRENGTSAAGREMINLLSEMDAYMTASGGHPYEERLLDAVRAGHDAVRDGLSSALISDAGTQRLKIMQVLLQPKVARFYPPHDLNNALAAAASSGREDLVQLVLQHEPATPYRGDEHKGRCSNDEWMPLKSFWRGHDYFMVLKEAFPDGREACIESAEVILNRGGIIKALGLDDLLAKAALQGNLTRLAEMLLSRGASVNALAP